MQVNEVSTKLAEAVREGPGNKDNLVRPSLSKGQDLFDEGKAQAKRPLSPKEAEEVVFAVQEELEKLNVRLVFSIDKDTNEVVVKVIDPETKEVIRQIPPEELLEIRKKLDEIVGILFDVRV